jgi:CRP-like cAMP-binding protein
MMLGAKPGLNYEDPLMYLPRKQAYEVCKGRIIYDEMNPPTHLYVVVLGRVKVSSMNGNGRQSVSRIVRMEGLFGEPCLIGTSRDGESATALDNVMLMGWDRAEIEHRIEQEPRLGIALFQYLVHQGLELQDRIETMAFHKTPERVMIGLLQLATDLGTGTEDGSTRVAHLTHETIAEFVGTSREIVSGQMNRLRRLGLIRYSRKYLNIDSRALLDELKRREMPIPRETKLLAQSAARRCLHGHGGVHRDQQALLEPRAESQA